MIFTRLFWADAFERATKTAAQFALVALGQDLAPVDAVNVFAVTWGNVAGLALGGAVVSVLMSVASAGTEGVSPASLVNTPKPSED
jgi:hypothetical protein